MYSWSNLRYIYGRLNMNTDFVIKRHDNDFSVVKRGIIPNKAIEAARRIVSFWARLSAAQTLGPTVFLEPRDSETVARALLSIAGDQT